LWGASRGGWPGSLRTIPPPALSSSTACTGAALIASTFTGAPPE
jgi:hypothetical protein